MTGGKVIVEGVELTTQQKDWILNGVVSHLDRKEYTEEGERIFLEQIIKSFDGRTSKKGKVILNSAWNWDGSSAVIKRKHIANDKVHRAIYGAFKQLDFTVTKSNFSRAYMGILLPYQINPSGVVFNREYKPLGVGRGGHVNYEDYPELTISSDATKKTLKLISKYRNDDYGYFYDAYTSPWASKDNFVKYKSLIWQFLGILEN